MLIMKKTSVFLFALCFVLPSAGASDPYRILGVLPDHSLEDITRAFQLIKFRIHPHRHGGSLEAKERFHELEEAYNNLQDPDFRNRYDSLMRESGKGLQEEPNLYKLLGVLSHSSPAKLTRAYREVRGRLHPDRHGGSRLANERLQELQKAHKTLLDPELRAQHDRRLKGTRGILTYNTVREQRAETSPAKKTAEGQEQGIADPPPFPPAPDGRIEDDVWNEQVFDLAVELEKAGGGEALEEAIEWYRLLARENHAKAIKRLAPLLERFNMKEALYRYRQAEALGDDDDFARVWAFRQAQFYQEGVSIKGEEIFPKNSEKAAKLYKRAFQLGADPQGIAEQYEKIGDYEEAIKWRATKPGSSGKKALRTKEEEGQQGLADFVWNYPSGKSVTEEILLEDGEIHLAIRYQDALKNTHQEKEENVLSMIRILIEEGTDINAQGFRKFSALNLVVLKYYFRAVWRLIDEGANVNLPDEEGDTPLHNALMEWDYSHFKKKFKGKDKIVTALNSKEIEIQRQIVFSLVEKTDLSVRNQNNKLPLHLAVERTGHSETAVWILQKMGDKKILTKKEKQELIALAIIKGYPEVVRLLKQAPVRGAAVSSVVKRRPLSRLLNLCRGLFRVQIQVHD